MGVNITTIAYLRVLIIEIGSTIILMAEAQGIYFFGIGKPAYGETLRVERGTFPFEGSKLRV